MKIRIRQVRIFLLIITSRKQIVRKFCIPYLSLKPCLEAVTIATFFAYWQTIKLRVGSAYFTFYVAQNQIEFVVRHNYVFGKILELDDFFPQVVHFQLGS